MFSSKEWDIFNHTSHDFLLPHSLELFPHRPHITIIRPIGQNHGTNVPHSTEVTMETSQTENFENPVTQVHRAKAAVGPDRPNDSENF